MAVWLEKSVGAGGKNLPIDVAAVEDLLNRTMQELPVKWDGVVGPTLLMRIQQFQRDVMHVKEPDGRVDPGGRTLAALNDASRSIPVSPEHRQGSSTWPAWRRLSMDNLALLYGLQFGSAPAGLKVLASAIAADQDILDVRWAAYMLATAWWETARTFAPIEEFGRGAGRPYGTPVDYTDAAGTRHRNTYFGRGYVQLTWLDNYKTLGAAIGLGDALAIDPSKALDPGNAYKIMSYGMRNGSFSTAHHKLGDYITGDACDYLRARQIINLMDHAGDISAQAVKLEMLLRIAST